MKDKCETCKYFEPQGNGVRTIGQPIPGFCHRNPPVAMMTNQGMSRTFAPVTNGDWCGEHEEAVLVSA